MKIVVSIVLMWLVLAGCPLEVHAQQATTAISITKEKDPNAIDISAYENKIVIENAPIGSKLEIYSVVGIRVKEIPMKQPSGEYLVDIAKGYYIVRIGDTVRKIAIR